MVVRLSGAALALFLSCGGAPLAKVPEGTVVRSAVGPDGAAIPIACTPSGPELCFNAIDDNCNGVLDEGCGFQTGSLQFMIAWGDMGTSADDSADVNLVVTDPDGRVAGKHDASAAATSSLLSSERDCPKDAACNGQNAENVYFTREGEPPPGRYKAEIKLVDSGKTHAQVRVHFGARIGAKTIGRDIELSPLNAEKTFVFEL